MKRSGAGPAGSPGDSSQPYAERRRAADRSFNTARKELIEGGHVKEVGGLVVPTHVEERGAPTADELIEILEGSPAGSCR